jgi:hypothetical protein
LLGLADQGRVLEGVAGKPFSSLPFRSRYLIVFKDDEFEESRHCLENGLQSAVIPSVCKWESIFETWMPDYNLGHDEKNIFMSFCEPRLMKIPRKKRAGENYC